MTTKEIIKNIYYFVETIVRSALFERGWDLTSYKDAKEWAFYCEKVYAEAVGRKFYHQLDSCIQELGTRIPNCPIPDLSLVTLEHAQHYLRVSLLQNPHLDLIMFQHLIDSAIEDGVPIDEELGAVQELTTMLDGLPHEVQESLSTQLLACHLVDEAWPTLKKERIPAVFEPIFESSPQTALSVLLEPDLPAAVKILVWEEVEARLCGLYSEAIWSLPPDYLCRLARDWQPFLQLHLSFLSACGQDLVQDARGSWLPREGSNLKPAPSYELLVSHLRASLLDPLLSPHLQDFLRQRARTAGQVWLDLIPHCHKLLHTPSN